MQDGALWQAVLGEIELSMSRGAFITYFKNTRLESHSDDTAVIAAPNVFIKASLETRYGALIAKTLAKNGVNPTNVVYKVAAVASTRSTGADDRPILVTTKDDGPNERVATAAPTQRQGLNERYTFDNFIVGSGNELAFAACQSIAANPGAKYNPLLLYGGVGIGKTHLIQAVGNAVLSKNPDARVIYVPSEQFIRELVKAIRFKTTADFANHYRSADVLIVDDIQFIAGKEKMQEEFFHTFNSLHQANRQIILTSDKPPRDISSLEDRLRSRFSWGMSIDMQIPDFETRCAIVQTKAHSQEVELTTDVVEYLANNVQTNIRELEGALNQLLAWCEMRELEPTIGIATSLLGIGKTRPKHLSAKQIIERTARYFQIPMEDIVGPKRDKDIVVPRQVAMYLLRSELHLSFPKIAHELGRKDHTTAIHSVEKMENEIRIDGNIRDAVSEIKDRLYA